VLEQPVLVRQRSLAAQTVDGPVAPGSHQPGRRVSRYAVTGPPLGRGREGLLRGFLSEIEVAEEADQ
jgi:hypothetical protein